jgi:hypothetical protein
MWPDGRAEPGRDRRRDHRDGERDEIARKLEAPHRGVGAATVELMEDRPHLTGDRGEAAPKLRLEWKAERLGDHHRSEALRRIQQTAGDPVPRR